MSGWVEVDLGWRYGSQQAAFAFFQPRVVEAPSAVFGPGIGPCFIELRSAFNLRLRKSAPAVQPPRFIREPIEGALSDAAYAALVTPIIPDAQRNFETPAIQISLNMHFIAEEVCTLTLMPPFHWPGYREWPGSLVCGTFPLRSWPRALNAVLEWQDHEREWVLRRGDPMALIWVRFDDPRKVPRLIEARATPELATHMARIDNVASFGRNVAPMMDEAERRRPARLLTPKKDPGSCPASS